MKRDGFMPFTRSLAQREKQSFVVTIILVKGMNPLIIRVIGKIISLLIFTKMALVLNNPQRNQKKSTRSADYISDSISGLQN